MPSIIDLIGLGAGLLLAAGFAGKRMVQLRALALAGSVLLLVYAVATGQLWVLGVAFVLAALNLWRMVQILRLNKDVGAVSKGRLNDFSAVHSFGTQVDIAEGAAVFRRGEPVDAFYLIESGKVQLQEIGITLGAGDILGEIGFFTDAEARTATAICIERTRVHMLTEAGFRRLQRQDPNFGMAVMRIATRRLADGLARHPAAYQGLVAPLGARD